MKTPKSDTPEHFLWQAGYHGGCACILLHILVQASAITNSGINLPKMSDDLKMFARSGFQWAGAYLDAQRTSPPTEAGER